MNLEELINKHGQDGVIPLFVHSDGNFSGPDGIKGRWENYEEDQSKILLVSDDGIVATCPIINLVNEDKVRSAEFLENRNRGYASSKSPRMTKFKVITDFPIAFDSPDHLAPMGTAQDNFSNKVWIKNIVDLFGRKRKIRILDLGCGGGSLVKDLLEHTPYAIGLEGSNYSIIHEREWWPQFHNNNLFTCDISRPFSVEYDNELFLCDIITAWEVCEHIHPDRIEGFFKNIYNHLRVGGVFMASVSDYSDESSDKDGNIYELHQSAMPEKDWHSAIESTGLFTIKEYNKSIGYVRKGKFLLHLEKI
jgi:SAM-dependent methyltransferase|tara:strand:- start:575 stop:1492 length:918 start_codon:yes stop_codon:yes gene_type:complete